MKVKVKLFASYRTGRFREAELECQPDTAVADLLLTINIKNVRGVILVNGKSASQNQILNDGDSLSVLPLIAGG